MSVSWSASDERSAARPRVVGSVSPRLEVAMVVGKLKWTLRGDRLDGQVAIAWSYVSQLDQRPTRVRARGRAW